MCASNEGLPLGTYVAPATKSSRVCALVIIDIDRINAPEEAMTVNIRILLLLMEVMIATGTNKSATTMEATKDRCKRLMSDPLGMWICGSLLGA